VSSHFGQEWTFAGSNRSLFQRRIRKSWNDRRSSLLGGELRISKDEGRRGMVPRHLACGGGERRARDRSLLETKVLMRPDQVSGSRGEAASKTKTSLVLWASLVGLESELRIYYMIGQKRQKSPLPLGGLRRLQDPSPYRWGLLYAHTFQFSDNQVQQQA